MLDYLNDASLSQSRVAERVDRLLEKLAAEYRRLPRREALALQFREALARVGLPGGYARRDAVTRPLAESIKGETQCS